MKNKGFTLIELLAVIVILAIIALIAVPIILDIIGDTKKQSDERSIELYAKAIENAIADYSLKNNGEIPKNIEDLEIEYEGNRVECEVSKINNDGTISLNKCKVNGNYVDYVYGKYTDNSGANTPDLMNNTLTPVIYNKDHWEIADITSKWYDYEKQEWANAVILKRELRNTKKVGDELNLPTTENDFESSDVLAMFVWIPRYSYTIGNTYGTQLIGGANPSLKTPGAIDIKFIDENVNENGTASYTDNIDNTWYTHPAFNFGGTQLSGIWVGKFETSHITYYNTTTLDQLNCTNEDCFEADNLRILPNVQSLRSQKVASYFYVSRSIERSGNAFGLNANTIDTHMMKNSEWGAVIYLSQSKYGKYGNSNYTNGNKEVYKNDSSSYYTGKSSGKPSEVGSSVSGTCKYDEEGSNRTLGTGLCGPGASTTGNITGVYDMSGGAYEYVMGNYNDNIGLSNFSSMPKEQYYDKYTTTDASSCGESCKGHALGETNNRWYEDYTGFVFSQYPWFLRGGYSGDANVAGVFNFYSGNVYGNIFSNFSFRVVLATTK